MCKEIPCAMIIPQCHEMYGSFREPLHSGADDPHAAPMRAVPAQPPTAPGARTRRLRRQADQLRPPFGCRSLPNSCRGWRRRSLAGDAEASYESTRLFPCAVGGAIMSPESRYPDLDGRSGFRLVAEGIDGSSRRCWGTLWGGLRI